MTPAWTITDYKVQGATYDSIIVDLHRQDNSRGSVSHKRYCSVYVQLSRVKSLQGLYLLQPVSLSDLNGKPDKLLVQEDDRIAQLARSTEIAWDQIEATDDFKYGRANRM
jgi:ATP-dependent exoDNAse (exonuclease V) alpha subunit